MDNLFLVAQFFGIVSLLVFCFSMQIDKRAMLLKFLLAVNALNAVVYFLLGSLAGGFISLVSVARLGLFSFYELKNEKCPLVCLFFFIALEIFVGMFSCKIWFDVLCILEAIVVTIGTYVKNMTFTRICHLFSCLLLVLFNFYVMAYSNLLSEFIGLIFTSIGILRLDIFKTQDKKHCKL